MKVYFLLGYAEPPDPSAMSRLIGEVLGADMVEWQAGGSLLIRPGLIGFADETVRVDAFPDGRRFYGTVSGWPFLWSPESAMDNAANALRLIAILDAAIVKGGAAFWMLGGETADIEEPQPWQFLESAAFGINQSTVDSALEAGFIRWKSAYIYGAFFDRILETFSRSDSVADMQDRGDRTDPDAVRDARSVQARFDQIMRHQ